MYFNSLWCYIMMIHGGCLIIFFLYYSMLITLPVIFLSLFIFIYIQKSIQLLCGYIVVWLYLCKCGLKRWCLFFFNVVCVHRSVLLPAAHIPTSLLPELTQATKNTDIYSFSFFNNLLRWSCDSRDNTAVLSQLPHDHQSPTGNERKR